MENLSNGNHMGGLVLGFTYRIVFRSNALLVHSADLQYADASNKVVVIWLYLSDLSKSISIY
jgi:hypothetical protein